MNKFLKLDLDPALNNKGEIANPSSPSRATVNLLGGTVAGSLKSTENPASSITELSRGNVVDPDMDTASGNYLSCSDTAEASV